MEEGPLYPFLPSYDKEGRQHFTPKLLEINVRFPSSMGLPGQLRRLAYTGGRPDPGVGVVGSRCRRQVKRLLPLPLADTHTNDREVEEEKKPKEKKCSGVRGTLTNRVRLITYPSPVVSQDEDHPAGGTTVWSPCGHKVNRDRPGTRGRLRVVVLDRGLPFLTTPPA